MTAVLKVYRRHNCHAEHRTLRALAKCMWPRAVWVAGEGRYATLAHCDVLTVQLHQTREAAESALGMIDRTGCGGGCHRHHELIRLGQAS